MVLWIPGSVGKHGAMIYASQLPVFLLVRFWGNYPDSEHGDLGESLSVGVTWTTSFGESSVRGRGGSVRTLRGDSAVRVF